MTELHVDRLARHRECMRATFYPKTDLAVPDAQLRALRATVPQALLATLGPFPGGPWQALPAQGTFHALYDDGAGQVLKALKCPQAMQGWQLHADALVAPHLRRAGLQGPHVAEVDCMRVRAASDFAVMDVVPGRPLAAFDHDDALLLGPLQRMGAYLRRVHAITGDGFGFLDVGAFTATGDTALRGLHGSWGAYLQTCLPEHLDLLAVHGLAAAPQREAIAHVLSAPWPEPARPSLLHGDCGSHNVFDDGDQFRAIDWEDALLGDPLFDLAFWASFHPQRRWPAMFQGYFGAAWLPVPDFWRYLLRIVVSKAVHRARFGYADLPGRPTAAERLAQALEGWCAAAAEAVAP